MEFGYILRRAWRITWEHRLLWVFGCLVSLGLMGGRLGVSGGQWELAVQELPPEVRQPIADFTNAPYYDTVTVIIGVLGFIVGVGLSLVGSLGRAGLVNQTRAAEDYGVIVLKGGWLAATRHFWRVFAVRLLLGLPVGLVLLLGLLPGIAARLYFLDQEQFEIAILGGVTQGLLGATCLTPAACVSVLLSVPIGVLQRLAARACVLEDLGVGASIARAWGILRENLGELALVCLITLGISIAAVMAIAFPLALLWGLLWVVARLTVVYSSLLSLGLTLVVGLLMWLVGVVGGGIAETFFSATWTLVYRDLTGIGRTGDEVVLVA